MTVLFRVNGSSSIGIGHVTECITLAHEISFPAVFAINDHPAPKRLMEQEGFPYHVVPGDDKETGSSFPHEIILPIMLQRVLKDAGIPFIAFKYAENSGQMQPIREQAGTFADSIKLWSGT